MMNRKLKALAGCLALASSLSLVSCAQGPHEEISYQLLKTGLGLDLLKGIDLNEGRANWVLFSDDSGFTQITDGNAITYTVKFQLTGNDEYDIASYSDIQRDEANAFYANTSIVIQAPQGASVATFITYDPYLNVKDWIAQGK